MCGRFSLSTDAEHVAEYFDLRGQFELFPRYNIAPTQPMAIVRENRDANSNDRELTMVHWGLVPRWAKDVAVGNRMINARSETAAEKPAFKSAMKYRRCLIPADGFYEWKKMRGRKQPYFIRFQEDRLMTFAGLWEHWQDEHGNELESATILTTSANSFLRDLHERMPVVLEPGDFDRWLDTSAVDPAGVTDLLRPIASGLLAMYPVSTRVNSPKVDEPSLLESVSELSDGDQPALF